MVTKICVDDHRLVKVGPKHVWVMTTEIMECAETGVAFQQTTEKIRKKPKFVVVLRIA